MDITYLGHSAFKLKFPTATVITDPFDPEKVGLKFPKISADIVTISHDHFDHNYLKGVGDVKKVIQGPGEYEVKSVSIIGFQFSHDDKKGTERGLSCAYLFEGQNLRILHLGDLGHDLSSGDIDMIGDVDILIIPVGGTYTIGPEKAVNIVRNFEPNIIIPMHYSLPGLNHNDFGELLSVDEFVKEIGLPVEKTDKLSIKDVDLNEESKLVLLNVK